MECPACKSPLMVIEHEQIEIDYCAKCRGIWFDTGELELLFGDAEACADFLTIGSPAEVPKGERPRKCPICGKRMAKESTDCAPRVVFDHCPNGDGLWFDHGELDVVLGHIDSLEGRPEVPRFLRGIFTPPAT